MECYLIHFSAPVGRCTHYVGFTKISALERFRQHQNNRGGKLLAEANKRNVAYSLVRIWPNAGRLFEKYLKSQKMHKYYCPVCNPNAPTNEQINQRLQKSKILTRLQLQFTT